MQQRGRSRYNAVKEESGRRKKLIRNWIIAGVAVLMAAAAIVLVISLTDNDQVSVNSLPCRADQNITVFGDGILYYDGVSVHSVSASGSIRWSFAVGANAQFSVSEDHLVLWSGSQLFILDKNGRPTYNEDMASEIQLARVGSKYCAVVIGGDTEPELLVKTMDGTQVDSETEAFSGMMLLDAGFYGESDQYMWSLSLDVYGVAINTVLNTFQVSKMNNGVQNLGEYLAYKVIYEDGHLRVFTTQQMYTYDYKAVQDTSRTELVFGWQLIDHAQPDRNKAAHMLLATTSQLTGSMEITELRVLTDTSDRRYSLPAACVGAGLSGNVIYAISGTDLYYTSVNGSRFASQPIQLPNGQPVTGMVGITSGNRAIVTSGTGVYAVRLPD